MKKALNIGILIVFLLLVVAPAQVMADSTIPAPAAVNETQKTSEKLVIYFFWGDGCPHCAAAKPVLSQMVADNPDLELKAFEIYYVDVNQDLFYSFGDAYGFTPRAVPTIIIGDQFWEGFTDVIQAEIEDAITTCLKKGCPDKGAAVLENNPYQLSEIQTPENIVSVAPTLSPVVEATPVPTSAPEVETPEPEAEHVKIPLIGEVDLSGKSLFLSTLLISFVDGFNPCSIWVLSMLLAITLHTGSRKKVLLIGFIFLTVTALIYALFIAGLFTVFTYISFVGWIQVLVALVALFFSIINIKDYFWYKEGLSFTISDDKKPGLYQKIRKVMEAGDSMWGLITGTVVLAAGVSLVEFSCTAGFPVLWTNLLVTQNVAAFSLLFFALLLVYMLVYQIDELGIFLIAVFSLKSSKLEEKHGRILKLIGGVLMFTLAIVMLVDPSVMGDIGKSLIVFGIAFGITLLILLLHRVIFPRLGIHIGTEFQKEKKKYRR